MMNQAATQLIKNEILKLTIPAKLEYLNVAIGFVREAARIAGFAENDLEWIDLAVEEAVDNVVEHAFSVDEEPDMFDIICERFSLGMRIRIKEKGMPFDPQYVPEYKPSMNLDQADASGMGLFLMRKMMDEVSFHNLGMAGKETILVKYLPCRNVKAYLGPEEKAESNGRHAEKNREKIPYHVHFMDASEAIEVSRCAYNAHGYTFFDEHIYYPERLVELNRHSELISAVAVTEDGKVMGHAALLYPCPGARIAELTFMFVNREYRGQGCMKALIDFLFNCPKKHPLEGVYAYSVANHELAQREAVLVGLLDCGLLLASSPETWRFKGINDRNPQRISVVLSFKYFAPPAPRVLYPPERHMAMVENLYRHIGMAGHPLCGGAATENRHPSGTGKIETNLVDSENCAEIHVFHYGLETVHEVKKIIRHLCLRQVAAIQLFLPLEDPLTALMAEDMESLGFFFAGIFPLSDVGEALILQYLNNVDIDYDKIILYTPTAGELRDYVRAGDPFVAL